MCMSIDKPRFTFGVLDGKYGGAAVALNRLGGECRFFIEENVEELNFVKARQRNFGKVNKTFTSLINNSFTKLDILYILIDKKFVTERSNAMCVEGKRIQSFDHTELNTVVDRISQLMLTDKYRSIVVEIPYGRITYWLNQEENLIANRLLNFVEHIYIQLNELGFSCYDHKVISEDIGHLVYNDRHFVIISSEKIIKEYKEEFEKLLKNLPYTDELYPKRELEDILLETESYAPTYPIEKYNSGLDTRHIINDKTIKKIAVENPKGVLYVNIENSLRYLYRILTIEETVTLYEFDIEIDKFVDHNKPRRLLSRCSLPRFTNFICKGLIKIIKQ